MKRFPSPRGRGEGRGEGFAAAEEAPPTPALPTKGEGAALLQVATAPYVPAPGVTSVAP